MLAGCRGGHAVTLRLGPAVALRDVPLAVTVTGLRSGQAVRIVGRQRDSLGNPWESSLSERADRHGRIVLPHSLLEGLLSPATRAAPAYFPVRSTITVSVRSGGKTLATGSVVRVFRPTNVKVVQLRPAQDGIYGTYFVPAGKRFGVPVLCFGGSEGGLDQGPIASLLAAHGHPTLEIAYFGAPGLPAQLHNIPLETFERALRWLQEQPQVRGRRAVVLGESYGGEASLLVGSTFPKLVAGVAAYVPFDIVSAAPAAGLIPAWTLHGRPIQPGTPIAVTRIAGPVFAVGSYGDRLWPSGIAVGDLKFELKGHDPKPTLYDFQQAGHAIGAVLPNLPTVTHVSSRYGELDLGGSPVADERVREATWPRLLAWLESVQPRSS